MQGYAKEKQLGVPLCSASELEVRSVDLPASVLQYKPHLDESSVGMGAWRERDPLIEMVVPLSVLQHLGRDVCAGQLVSVCCSAAPDTQHLARIIPVQACQQPLLPPAAAHALGIDQATCKDTSNRSVALLSPFLAFNLGVPYHLAQLVPGDASLNKWLHSKANRITITCIPQVFPSPSAGHLMNLRRTWAPGNFHQEVPLAAHVGLAHIRRTEKPPPFDIEEHQTAIEKAAADAQAAQAGAPQEPGDQDLIDLQAAEVEAESNAMMAVRTLA